MTEALRSFLLDGRDYNWLVELSLCAAAWVVLRFSIGGRPKWYRALPEFALLLAVMSAGFLLSVALVYPRHYVPILWGFLHGMIAYFYLRCFSSYRKKTRILLWLAHHSHRSSSASASLASFIFRRRRRVSFIRYAR